MCFSCVWKEIRFLKVSVTQNKILSFFVPQSGIKQISAYMEFQKHLSDLKFDQQVSLGRIVRYILISHNFHLRCESEVFTVKSTIPTNPNYTSFLWHTKHDTHIQKIYLMCLLLKVIKPLQLTLRFFFPLYQF